VIRTAATVAAGLVALTTLAGCGGRLQPRSTGSPATLTITPAGCGPNWAAPRAGRSQLTVANRLSTTYSVDLLGADQTSVYGEIDVLGPGTTGTMDVVLPPGRYSVECESIAGSSTFSEVRSVIGPPVTGAQPYVPVDFSQIQLATLRYRSALTTRLAQLTTDTDALQAALADHDLDQARQRWLTAHLDYERLGAAYDTFGDLGAEIDGRPNGLPGGVDDPRFAGFLRLEYGLWHSQPPAVLAAVGTKLDTTVHTLATRFPQMQTPANDLSLRTHEILENTLQFELTGESDEGSHTTLATALAKVQGTDLTLQAITPLLRPHQTSLLASTGAGLSHLATALQGYDRSGHWTALGDLTRSQREDLDAAVSSLLEQLSVIPDLLELPVQPDTADS
jgi:iron uptake system EfeUOB component EfeO/EfeM